MKSLVHMSGCTPADLQDMGMSVLMYLNPLALTTSDRSADSLSALQHEVSPAVVNRTSSIGNPLTLTALRASVVKSRRGPRSKASHLPNDIQLSLNTMLASGRPY